MIDTALWRRLQGLMFSSRRAVEGVWVGRHASPRHGVGQEFHDYRAYSPGDAISDIDWKLYGRSDRWYVRRHRVLTDLHAYVMVDATASMDFAGVNHGSISKRAPRVRPARQVQSYHEGFNANKWDYATTLAAAISHLAIRQSDRAGVGIFTDHILQHVPPGGTWAHLQRVVATLEAARPTAEKGNIAQALAQAHALLKRRGMLIVISDLLDDPALLFQGLARFVHARFDVIVFQVLHPQELDLQGLAGWRGRLADAETGGRIATDASRVRERYAQLMREHIATINHGCVSSGIDYNLLTTDQPVAEALRRYLLKRSSAR